MTTQSAPELRTKLLEAQAEIQALRALLEENGVPSEVQFFYWKSIRQRDALDYLNRKVTTLHFVLRTIEQLGRGLSREEWVKARDAVENTQLKERIASEPLPA